MPLNISKVTSTRAQAVIDFGDGDVLHIEYYPKRITGKMIADSANAGAAARENPDLKDPAFMRQIAAAVTDETEQILTLVASWDLTQTTADGTEATIPLDRAHIEALPLDIQRAILKVIFGDDSETGKSSAPAQVDGAANGSLNAQPSDATS